jgi:hypothetical protein
LLPTGGYARVLVRRSPPVDNRSEIAILDKLTKTSFYHAMSHSLTITLDTDTFAWLTRQAASEQSTPAAVVEALLRELADPENVEGDLMDRLLLQSVDFFPPVMTLDEHDEHRDEIIDYTLPGQQ